MREILFRGKQLGKIDDDFVYGSLGVIDSDLVAIYQCHEFVEDDKFLVDIGTVGQYTGLIDKNGTKIFEGDIFKFDDEVYESIHTWCGTEYNSYDVENYGVIGFDDERGCFDFVKYKFDENLVDADLLNEADLVFEDGDWEVWVPKTYAASCKLGQGSSWCTASTESDYYYNYYTSRGDLYILINKHNPNEKYQFHLETNSFMDVDDSPINWEALISPYDELYDFFKEKLLDSVDWKPSPENPNEMILDISKERLAKVISANNFDFTQSFVYDALNGNAFEYFSNYMDYAYITKDSFRYWVDMIDDNNFNDIIEISNNTITTHDELNHAINYTENEDIIDAIKLAALSTEELAAEYACISDFEYALNDAGIKSKSGSVISDVDDLYTIIDLKNVLHNLYDILDYADIEDWFFEQELDIEVIEPRYGWQGEPSPSVFNDELSYRLSDLI